MGNGCHTAKKIELQGRTDYIRAGYKYSTYLRMITLRNIGRHPPQIITPITEEDYNQQLKEHALKELISCNVTQ
jgi:hypothetical protein